MKQYPSNYKYKKNHKINKQYIKASIKKNFYLIQGLYGIQSLESGKILYKQIESCRRTYKRGKQGNLIIKLFTNVAVTKKALATRMGKGKGNISHWMVPVKKGQILFESIDMGKNKTVFLLKKTKNKLPIKTRIIQFYY